MGTMQQVAAGKIFPESSTQCSVLGPIYHTHTHTHRGARLATALDHVMAPEIATRFFDALDVIAPPSRAASFGPSLRMLLTPATAERTDTIARASTTVLNHPVMDRVAEVLDDVVGCVGSGQAGWRGICVYVCCFS